MGTYNPKLEAVEVNTGANMISFENSTLISKNKTIDESKLMKKKLLKIKRSLSNIGISILETNKDKIKEEDEEYLPKMKEMTLNPSKSNGLF